MNKFIRILFLGVFATLTLAACGPSDEEKAKAEAEAAAAEARKPVPMPASATDTAAWRNYLGRVVMNNMQGVKTNSPFMYFVPAGDSADVQDQRNRQLDEASGVVARGVLPGNMMAFGGPDSKATADVIVAAFKDARDGSCKGVVFLFVGAAADQDRVKDAVAKSGVEFRFAEMK